MKARVDLHRRVNEAFGDPLATIEIPHLHLKLRNLGSNVGGRECEIRSRLIDEDGGYATDFEHDGASSFAMTLAVTNEQIITEDWFEVAGVVTDVRAWGHPFVRQEDGDPWDNAHDCDDCKGQHEDATPHKMVEHYVPPEAYKMIANDGKELPVYGRFAVLRWHTTGVL